MSPETRQALNKVKAHLRKVGQIADRLAAKDDPCYDLSDIITNLENIMGFFAQRRQKVQLRLIIYSPTAEAAGFEVPAPTFMPSHREASRRRYLELAQWLDEQQASYPLCHHLAPVRTRGAIASTASLVAQTTG